MEPPEQTTRQNIHGKAKREKKWRSNVGERTCEKLCAVEIYCSSHFAPAAARGTGTDGNGTEGTIKGKEEVGTIGNKPSEGWQQAVGGAPCVATSEM